jgi:hypothetical protein
MQRFFSNVYSLQYTYSTGKGSQLFKNTYRSKDLEG